MWGTHKRTLYLLELFFINMHVTYHIISVNRCLLFLYHALGGDSAEEAVVGGLRGLTS